MLGTSLHPPRDTQDTLGHQRPWDPAERQCQRRQPDLCHFPLWTPVPPRPEKQTLNPWEVSDHPRSGDGTALTCSEHMEFIPGICSEFICICPAMGFMFWTLVFPPAMETVMLMLLYMPC